MSAEHWPAGCYSCRSERSPSCSPCWRSRRLPSPNGAAGFPIQNKSGSVDILNCASLSFRSGEARDLGWQRQNSRFLARPRLRLRAARNDKAETNEGMSTEPDHDAGSKGSINTHFCCTPLLLPPSAAERGRSRETNPSITPTETRCVMDAATPWVEATTVPKASP